MPRPRLNRPRLYHIGRVAPRPIPPEERFRELGAAPPDAHCMHCQEGGEVFRIRDRTVMGSKSETLHRKCAAAWFATGWRDAADFEID